MPFRRFRRHVFRVHPPALEHWSGVKMSLVGVRVSSPGRTDRGSTRSALPLYSAALRSEDVSNTESTPSMLDGWLADISRRDGTAVGVEGVVDVGAPSSPSFSERFSDILSGVCSRGRSDDRETSKLPSGKVCEWRVLLGRDSPSDCKSSTSVVDPPVSSMLETGLQNFFRSSKDWLIAGCDVEGPVCRGAPQSLAASRWGSNLKLGLSFMRRRSGSSVGSSFMCTVAGLPVLHGPFSRAISRAMVCHRTPTCRNLALAMMAALLSRAPSSCSMP
mmetsp:Transcript_28464/g.71503  ORF Transcript_28464/g.71503 Transcript_28464/m.71503 type:complete len:275 (+) Transcript_28464:1868-2692(+)